MISGLCGTWIITIPLGPAQEGSLHRMCSGVVSLRVLWPRMVHVLTGSQDAETPEWGLTLLGRKGKQGNSCHEMYWASRTGEKSLGWAWWQECFLSSPFRSGFGVSSFGRDQCGGSGSLVQRLWQQLDLALRCRTSALRVSVPGDRV